ncbi:MAG: chorismate synthase [Tissierellia bacterium]|nr:chorismate synthase [Tissierellia bacterium]
MRFLTGGESHGDCLVGIVEGFPAKVFVDIEFINKELERRQRGYGRGKRMEIEKDKIDIVSGVRDGFTTGNPISLIIKNKGKDIEQVEIVRPRPGHGDLAGTLKYNFEGGRNVLERASARETAMRVAVGSLCKLFLKKFNIGIYSHVVQIGKIKVKDLYYYWNEEELIKADTSPVRVLDKESEILMIKEIEKAKEVGDTLGGVIEVIGKNVPVGLGSFTNWDRKIDSKIAKSIMSIPGVKGIEFGLGFEMANNFGSQVHDEIYYNNKSKKFYRKTNNAGGIEAGVTNGEDIVFRLVMKPIPTLRKPLKTVDIRTKKEAVAQFERSDVCAVPSASIVAENMLAYVLANELILKFGGDTINEIYSNYTRYMETIKNF